MSSATTSATAAAVSADDFDQELEAERLRWLRLRFLWYCAVYVTISVALDYASFGEVFLAEERREFLYHLINALGSLLSIGAYVGAALYVWRAPPRERTVFRLVYWLYVVVTCVGLVYARIAMQLEPERKHDPAIVWLIVSTGGIFVNHTLACLFMPWTVRESLWAAAIPLLVNVVIVTIDVFVGPLGIRAFLLILVVSPLTALPGSVICWLRYSRLREWARLKLESARFRQLQHELQAARRLHEACLPPRVLDGPVRLSYAYEPMRQIGGDLLYVHPPAPVKSSRINVIILDVTGHGIAAALTVNRLVGELDRLFAERPDVSPVDLLCALNRYVFLTLASHNIYVTALCMRIDAAGGVVRWANGGHPPAFLRRRDGRIERLESSAPLLGVVDGQEYVPDPGEAMVEPGDTIVAYTDGAAEARDRDGRQVGIAGIERLVTEYGSNGRTPVEWPAAMLRRVVSHRGAAAEDDTLLVTLHCPAS